MFRGRFGGLPRRTGAMTKMSERRRQQDDEFDPHDFDNKYEGTDQPLRSKFSGFWRGLQLTALVVILIVLVQFLVNVLG